MTATTPRTTVEADGPSLIDRLRTRFSRSTADLGRMQETVDKQQREMRRIERQMRQLEAEFTAATEALALADQRFASYQGALRQLEAGMLEAWANPFLGNGPDYSATVMFRAAIEDFPRCRTHLAAKVETARLALRAFEKQHAQ